MTSQRHNPFDRWSRYGTFERYHKSMQQSPPMQPFSTLGDNLRLFLTVFGVVMLTLFSAASAEFESCAVPNIRLYGGKTNFDGGLYVQTVDGQWQRLCLQWNYAGLQFNDLDGPVRIAQVICRSLGFRSEKASAIFDEHYLPEELPGTSNNFFTILSLKCHGNESQISECHPLFQEVNISLIKFNEEERHCFSGIACGDDPHFAITFDSFRYPTELMTSLFINTSSVITASSLGATAFDLRGPVCAEPGNGSSHARIAQVACRELGSRIADRAKTSNRGVAVRIDSSDELFVDYVVPILSISCLMSDTKCSGREQSIADCDRRKLWGSPFFSLESDDGWNGEQVALACLMNSSDWLQLTTGAQLFNNSTGNDGVFIKYGSMWLPVINSADPYTCRAICNALHKEGPSIAICRTETLTVNFQLPSSGMAFIFCDAKETHVNDCAHLLMEWQSATANVSSSRGFYHVHARCAPVTVSNSSGYLLELHAFPKHDYRGNVSTGCLKLNLESHKRLWVTAVTPESAQFIATMTCQRLYQKKKTYASYIFSNELAKSATRTDYWRELDAPSCPLASAFIGCPPNAKSISDCAIQLNEQSTSAQHALGIICAPAIEDIKMRIYGTVHGHDGVVTLSIGPHRALASIDKWSDIAASVTCRELGINDTAAHRAIRKAMFIQKHIWLLTNVNCTGAEKALLECKHEWTATSLPFDSYIAGVSCERDGSKVKILPFSNRSNSGIAAIELYPGNTTGRFYFCSVSKIENAEESQNTRAQTNSDIAFCKAAGYPRTKNAVRLILPKSSEPTTSGFEFRGVFAFTNFVCHEKNSPLEECSYEWLGRMEYCPKPELSSTPSSLALALRCDEYEFGTMVRLVGGATPYEGHVEVMYKGEWGAVCDDRFDMDASTVVCRQLFGPESQGKPVPGSRFATKNERFLLDEVRCSPTHNTLAECAHNAWGDHDCGPCEQIGVICSKVNFIRQPIAAFETEGGRPQLVCFAEGQPTPSYQWFTTGSPLLVASDRVDVVCQDLDKVQYTCNAFNDAGESFVHVVLDRKSTCGNETVGKAKISTSNTWMITLSGVGITILLLLLLGAIWKIFALRKSLEEVRQADGKEQKNMSYIVLSESPGN